MRIEYVATRKLAPGHSVDTSYELAVYADTLDSDIDAKGSRQVSLDRSRVESELYGIDRLYSVVTDHIPIGQASAEFEEFLESVINGENFIFDPDSDVVASIVNPLSALLESTGYSPRRNLPGHFQYAFTVRIL